MTTSQLVVPAIVAILGVALNAIVNVKLRFATDEKSAWQSLRGLALRGVTWLSVGTTAVLFAMFPFSAAPLTRARIAVFVIQGCSLTFVIVTNMIYSLLDLNRAAVNSHSKAINSHTEAIDGLLRLHSQHVELTGTVVNAVAREHVAPPDERTDSGAA